MTAGHTAPPPCSPVMTANRSRLLPALALMVLVPVVIAAWLGQRLAEDEGLRLERRFQALVEARLEDSARLMERVLDARRRALLTATADLAGAPAPALAARAAALTAGEQLFLLTPDGRLRHPDPGGPLSERERAFLERTHALWSAGTLGHPGRAAAGDGDRDGSDHGWHPWHWGSGLRLLFWRRLGDGAIAGAEVDPLDLVTELIGLLPDGHGGEPGTRIRLGDSRGRVLYQWGPWDPPADAVARGSVALAPPLGAWRLEYFSAAPLEGGRILAFQAAIAVAALGLVLLLAAGFLYRELTRALREAAQRVTFVNQVSHELKTPLTNIRLYAELLDSELDTHDPARARLAVITQETRRLGRLIANVLSFARGQRRALTLYPRPLVLDHLVREVVAQHAPALGERGVRVETDLAAPDPLLVDGDALTQILGNLLGNVEKYAAAGGLARVTTRLRGAWVEVRVADLGPGIPARQARRVFEPFYRVRGDLTEGVSGTGIGLAVARDLARLHGGDLVLEPAPRGAVFLLTLPRRTP